MSFFDRGPEEFIQAPSEGLKGLVDIIPFGGIEYDFV